MREMTEEEAQVLRTGLRMLARMIARRHLAVKAAEYAEENRESEEPRVSAEAAGLRGDE